MFTHKLKRGPPSSSGVTISPARLTPDADAEAAVHMGGGLSKDQREDDDDDDN